MKMNESSKQQRLINTVLSKNCRKKVAGLPFFNAFSQNENAETSDKVATVAWTAVQFLCVSSFCLCPQAQVRSENGGYQCRTWRNRPGLPWLKIF
jgi:hypothetical protein